MARQGLHQLTPREREVLTSIVLQFIHTGEPVGSRTVAKTNTEDLSSATIRSIMADLEEAGFITHPHTSAGRVPTDLGYRSYVDALQAPPALSAAERETLADRFHAAGGMGSLLQRCCTMLAAASHQIGIVTASDPQFVRFRHVELIKVSEQRLLVLFVSQGGLVEQHLLSVRIPETQAELDRHARYLNDELGSRSITEVRARLVELMADERARYDGLARRALDLASRYFASEAGDGGNLIVDGQDRFLGRPDLSDLDRMKTLLVALEDKRRMLDILSACTADTGVSTVIGTEAEAPELAGCAVVSARYGVDAESLGTIGIIGPTRMDYDRAMALVEYVAEMLGSVLAASRA